MVDQFFYYIFCSSTILMYGISLKQGVNFSQHISVFGFYCIKSFVTSSISVIIIWVIAVNLLVPFGLVDLLPIFIFFIALFISKMIDIVTTILFSKSFPETFSSILIVYFALTESISFSDSILLVIASCFSLLIFVPVLYAITKKIDSSTAPQYLKPSSLIFISIAFILLALYAWNISWLNFEVSK